MAVLCDEVLVMAPHSILGGDQEQKRQEISTAIMKANGIIVSHLLLCPSVMHLWILSGGGDGGASTQLCPVIVLNLFHSTIFQSSV